MNESALEAIQERKGHGGQRGVFVGRTGGDERGGDRDREGGGDRRRTRDEWEARTGPRRHCLSCILLALSTVRGVTNIQQRKEPLLTPIPVVSRLYRRRRRSVDTTAVWPRLLGKLRAEGANPLKSWTPRC